MRRKNICVISFVLFVIFLINDSVSLAHNQKLITPMSKRCTPSTSYTDRIDTTYKKQEFSYIIEKSSIPQTVTRNVTLTSSLSVKGSISGEANIVIAKSKVNFELGYVGSKADQVTVSWGPIVNRKVKLVAGKVWARTIGQKTMIDIYCDITRRSYYIEGSYDNYSDAYDIK